MSANFSAAAILMGILDNIMTGLHDAGKIMHSYLQTMAANGKRCQGNANIELCSLYHNSKMKEE